MFLGRISSINIEDTRLDDLPLPFTLPSQNERESHRGQFPRLDISPFVSFRFVSLFRFAHLVGSPRAMDSICSSPSDTSRSDPSSRSERIVLPTLKTDRSITLIDIFLAEKISSLIRPEHHPCLLSPRRPSFLAATTTDPICPISTFETTHERVLFGR